jgi:hypothetical protein
MEDDSANQLEESQDPGSEETIYEIRDDDDNEHGNNKESVGNDDDIVHGLDGLASIQKGGALEEWSCNGIGWWWPPGLPMV